MPEKQRPTTLDEALAQLMRDTDHPVRARVGELDVELKVVGGGVKAQAGLGDLMASAGPWEGESTDELIRILREGRDAGGRVHSDLRAVRGAGRARGTERLVGRPLQVARELDRAQPGDLGVSV